MRLTVMGATGRTGRPLVRQPLDRGHDVVGFALKLQAGGVLADARQHVAEVRDSGRR